MKKPKDCSHTFKSIAESLDTIAILADILAENTTEREGCAEGSHDEQINTRGETGIQVAIRLIAYSAHGDLCKMATDLGVPE